MATKVSAPYVTKIHATPNSEGHLFEGMFAEIFTSLQELMNFTYSLNEPPDGEWGAQNADLSWTGMIGMLETKAADIGNQKLIHDVTPLAMFTQPLFQMLTCRD